MGSQSSFSPVFVCRPALPKDTPQVLELSGHIWEGHHYIPSVWEDWLGDAHGLLCVVEYGKRMAGFGKLTRLSASQWWLEGLRVHPDFEGRGIASHIHDYLLQYWLQLIRKCNMQTAEGIEEVTGSKSQHLYWLVFVARHPLPIKFWEDIRSVTHQRSLGI